MKRKLKGFTLVELIVVIAIVGVLAAILVPQMMGYIRESRVTTANANARAVRLAAQSKQHSLLAFGDRACRPDGIYICSDGSGVAYEVGGEWSVNLRQYLSTGFNDCFAFQMSPDGETVLFALWSKSPIDEDEVRHYDMDELQELGGRIGCHFHLEP